MQKFWKSVKIWQSYREFTGGPFFETQCINRTHVHLTLSVFTLQHEKVAGHVAEVDKLVPTISESSASSLDPVHWTESVSNSRSAAERLTDAIQSGAMSKISQSRTKPKQKLIVCKSANSKLQSVTTCRKVKLFVSRVAPTIIEDDLKDFVREAVPSCPGSYGCAASGIYTVGQKNWTTFFLQ